MKQLLRQALGYGAASFAALFVDVALLSTLVNAGGWDPIAAAAVAFLVGAVVAYILSRKLAFNEHRLRDRRVEFLSFLAIGTLGLALNSLVMSIAIRYFALHYLVAKGVAAGFTFVFNFLARRQLLFVPSASRRPDA